MIKILVEKETNLIKYQGMDYELLEDKTIAKNSNGDVLFIIGDLNLENAEVFDVGGVPEDWEGNKYKYINNEFILNE